MLAPWMPLLRYCDTHTRAHTRQNVGAVLKVSDENRAGMRYKPVFVSHSSS